MTFGEHFNQLIDNLLARHRQIVQERREAQDDADVAAANAARRAEADKRAAAITAKANAEEVPF